MWAGATLSSGGQEVVLGLSAESLTEVITAAVCAVVLGVTLVAVQREEAGLRVQHGRSAAPASPLNDYLLPVAVVLLGGVAGLGFASLFPLGDPSMSLVFYWAIMAGVLALILDGAREPVNLAAGLLAILNAVALLVYALS